MGNNSSRFLWLFEILNFLINYDWFFWLIGKFNKSGWIKSIFLSYPANYVYARGYAYEFRLKNPDWKVRLSGFLRQNGKLTIMFTIFVLDEREFQKKENEEKLKEVAWRVEKIRLLIRADEKTFAGILPGLLSKRKIMDKSPEADITASIVVKAIEAVKREVGIDEKVPFVVLGGGGFIGRKVIDRLKLESESDIYPVDVKGHHNKWPGEKRRIIINAARHDTISFHLDELQEGDVVVNEAYPGPDSHTISRLRELKCDCFHVVGVEATAFPQFTYVYSGGVPCCAAWNSGDIKVIVKKLT